MNKDFILRVSNLGKYYYLYNSPWQKIISFLGFKKNNIPKLWVLKNVTFNLRKGEILAIIGANGSGKSTLLSILSGITSQSSGEYITALKVASLLELGAGFNRDLSGIDNIYLLGLLNGLSKTHISNIIDEIITFSELEDFIQRPIKTYSSGMYVRLAFSINIHFRPDIFIIDEALSVGDHRFIQKCMVKINQIKKEGISFIIVTHDASAVKEIADQALWLKDGKVFKSGNPSNIVDQYRDYYDKLVSGKTTVTINDRRNTIIKKSNAINGYFKVDKIFINAHDQVPQKKTWKNKNLEILIKMTKKSHLDFKLVIGFRIKNKNGLDIYSGNSLEQSKAAIINCPKGTEIEAKVSSILPSLSGGLYTISLAINIIKNDGEQLAVEVYNDFYAFTIHSINPNPSVVIFKTKYALAYGKKYKSPQKIH
jgi:ABC-type polysaccharide/polyol phosphate transport system ATPase subunit